jgi:class 3 adenylate cyclase
VQLASDDLHMDYSAMGQTVHLTSRLEQVASGEATVLFTTRRPICLAWTAWRSAGQAR